MKKNSTPEYDIILAEEIYDKSKINNLKKEYEETKKKLYLKDAKIAQLENDVLNFDKKFCLLEFEINQAKKLMQNVFI